MLVLQFFRRALVAVVFILLSTVAMAQKEPLPPKVVQPTVDSLSAPPVIKGASALLMDVDTGRVLYGKNPHAHLSNASTTKIMTAILLIEHCKMTDKIKASKNVSETPYTSLHLKPGETITVKDLLTGMLVRSANDAAVAAAEHIAGNTTKFAAMMNRKAKKIGCTDTHFVTPNGLYDPNHYTSAHDLCLMARYAMRYPIFNEAVNTRKYFLSSRTINRQDMCVFTHSPFLRDYPGADGVKSGYTKQAKHCYVGSATRDGWRLVSAVLGSPNACNDTAALMNYGFANFQLVSMLNADEKCADVDVDGGRHKTVSAIAVKDLKVPVPKTGATITTQLDLLPIEAPITKGAKLGKLKALVNGRQVAAIELKAGEDVGISLARMAWMVTKGCGILLVVCLIGGRYGRTFTKGTRRRRRRVSSSMRDYNHRW